MVELDTFNYFIRPRATPRTNTEFDELLSRERKQKLDLISHLLLNSRQAVVLCGPPGIGKSTFLAALPKQKSAAAVYCLVSGHPSLTIVSVQAQIAKAIKQQDNKALRNANKPNLVLMIDDAGQLAVGMINALIAYTAQHQQLKLVFALSNDELEEKTTADSQLDRAHIIEIPALTEQQSRHYIHHLAINPQAQLAFEEINDELCAVLHEESNGNPGFIKAKLLLIEDIAQHDQTLRVLLTAVAALVVLALAIQWYSATDYHLKGKPFTAGPNTAELAKRMPTSLMTTQAQPKSYHTQTLAMP